MSELCSEYKYISVESRKIVGPDAFISRRQLSWYKSLFFQRPLRLYRAKVSFSNNIFILNNRMSITAFQFSSYDLEIMLNRREC